MAYTIYNNDGTVLLTLADGDIDISTTSLDLVGKNVNNYGQYINNNLIKLLTSSANDTEPRSPQIGQLWYDKSENRLKIYNGSSFEHAYGATVSDTFSTPPGTGDLWYNDTTGEFRIYSGAQWLTVDPRIDAQYGRFGIIRPDDTILDNDFNQPQDLAAMYSFGEIVGLVSTSSFDMTSLDSAVYLNTSTASTIVAGITILQDLEVKGNLYVNGYTLYDKNLSLNYDISSYDPATWDGYLAGNVAIRNDLSKVFPIETISTLSQVAYVLGSEVRVLCSYSGVTSVRRFILEEDTPGVNLWNPYNLYSSGFSTNTNIVS